MRRIKIKKKWLLLIYIPIYFILFALLELYITNDYPFWSTVTIIDRYIPFVPIFIVFYFSWYFLMLYITIYLFIKDEKSFCEYMYFIIIGFSISLLIFILIPNGQTLRPVILKNDIFSKLISYIYSVDTYTNVFPSMHVIGCLAGLIAYLESKKFNKKCLKVIFIIWSFLICISTLLVKQHAFIDGVCSIVICLILYILIYKIDYKKGK